MIFEVHYDEKKRQFYIPMPDRKVRPEFNEWPGWRRDMQGNYRAAAWPSALLSMGKTTASLRWTEGAAKQRDLILGSFQLARTSLSQDDRSFSQLKKWPTEREPRVHQRQAVNAIRHMGCRVLLADDMGLGKTASALWAAHDAGVTKLLVICPVSVKFNWQNEINVTLGEPWVSIVVDGSPKMRAQQLVDAAQSVKWPVATIINYDLLRHLSEFQLDQLKLFASTPDSLVLLDESHYCKSKDAERTGLVMKITATAPRVIAMTGTPIRNIAEDLYSQVEIIRPGTWTSYSDFAKRHLTVQLVKFSKAKKAKKVRLTVGVKNVDALNATMNTLQIKRKKAEVGGLPPRVYTFPELQLEDDHLRIYKTMREYAKIDLGKLLADESARGLTIFDPRARSGVEQAMRCEQIASGFIGGVPTPLMEKLGPSVLKLAEKIPGRPNELMFPTSPKIVWLLEAIECVIRQGGAPIILSRFNAPLVWLSETLIEREVKPSFIHGNLSAVQKNEQAVAFQDKRTHVMLSQTKIAEGWNAPRSQDVFFLCRDWSPAINDQGESRAHRMGQLGTVNVQIPVVMNTVERMIHKRLATKGADAENALRTLTIEELMEAL